METLAIIISLAALALSTYTWRHTERQKRIEKVTVVAERISNLRSKITSAKQKYIYLQPTEKTSDDLELAIKELEPLEEQTEKYNDHIISWYKNPPSLEGIEEYQAILVKGENEIIRLITKISNELDKQRKG
ncbi:hypothetical protein [Malonomonas rubra]|uniref:hypothetical protein n=1 Tax=Malonomonas rubra TaxID=57040 RepID=UPI0026EDFC48|nr:hypothetical protein [Malonomonas rubra]